MDLLDAKIKLKETRSLFNEKRDETEEAIEAGDVDKAKELKAEVDKIRTDLDELTTKVEELEADKDEDEQEEQDDEQTDETNTNEGGEERMENRQILGGNNEVSEEVRAFQNFVETREIDGDNLKTDSGYVVVPEEVVNNILKIKQAEFNLDKYVNVKPVGNGAGKYPVIREGAVQGLPTVEELQENPKLAVSPYFELAYDIKTHRGFFRVSQELIEDAAVNVLAELNEYIGKLVAATRNKAILDAIEKGTQGEGGTNVKFKRVSAEGVDGIKDVLNLQVSPNYTNTVAIMNQSAYNEIDKLTDRNGRYLLQDNISAPSGKQLLGAPVEVISDKVLKSKADKHPVIVGDLKSGITLFERSQYQAKWEDYMHFGTGVMVSVRQDCRIADKEAAIVIDFSAPVEQEPEEPASK